ncbi:MAG: gamma-glutamyl-gamma-aminobutyrate hydrolase family protein, partial [Pseudomonadota bacterium]
HYGTPDHLRSLDLTDLDWPRIIKPSDGVGGRGVEKVDGPDDLHAYFDASGEGVFLLQSLIEGEDFCVSIAADDGKLTGCVAYKNLRQFPVEAGAGAVRETVDAAPFLPATEKLVKAAGWSGVAEIDFRWDGRQETEPKIIEVNPRFWAGLFHSVASGVDFPWLAYASAAGLDVPHADREDVKVGYQTKTSGAWLLSVVEETLSSDEHMDKAKAAWSESSQHLVDGKKRKAIAALAESIFSGAKGLTAAADIPQESKSLKDLPSELSVDDDPAVGFGVLFAVSSLLRHGKLPDELTFEGEDDTPRTPHVHRVDRREGRPVIGITKPDDGDWLAYQAMRTAVLVCGGEPVKITSKAPREPHSVDGLLLGGGSDVYPERYGGLIREGYRYDLARDEMEASWADAANTNGIPVLAICRGMQMMNVLGGGTLWPDLNEYEHDNPTTFWGRTFYRKPIELESGSTLAAVTGEEKLQVNAIHTQAVRDVAPGFRVAAREPNGIIQAIEGTGDCFRMGLQFHPEFLIHRTYARRIFAYFIRMAMDHRDTRQPAL